MGTKLNKGHIGLFCVMALLQTAIECLRRNGGPERILSKMTFVRNVYFLKTWLPGVIGVYFY